MTGRVVPREVQARILEDLGRGHRSISAIAERHHVPVEAVFLLRDKYGPGLPGLTAAAKELRRPPAVALSKHPPAAPEVVAELVAEVCPTRKPAKASPKGGGYTDGLTDDERTACKDWAVTQGEKRPRTHCSRALIAAWEAAGRPSSPIKTGENDEDPMDDNTAPGALNDLPQDCPAPDPVLDDVVVDAEVLDDDRPDWDPRGLVAVCRTIPDLATEVQAVLDAVDMLTEAHDEWAHRQAMIQRVRDAIKPQGLHLTADQVRIVLDAIEAA